MKLPWIASLPLIILLSCGGPPQGLLDDLARHGDIQEDAPVKAVATITINASAEKVWELLVDVDRWPKWQPEISEAKLNGPLQPGTEFTWKGGAKIRSTLALVHPSSKLVWTEVAYMAKAAHVWELKPLADKQTLVVTKESMDGTLLTVFYSSGKLKESEEQWLKALKAAAEH